MDQKSDQNIKKALGLDEFLEDLFGLNIKGLKTLWASFRRPKDYYASAWSPDWQGKYTPSFRLWFTLMAILFFFQFFWGGNDSTMIEATTAQIESANNSLPDGVTAKDAAIIFARLSFGFLPIMNALTLLAFAGLYHAWGRSTSFVIRQRNVFITIIPSTFIVLCLMMFQRGINAEHITLFNLVLSLAAIFIDGITAYRGAFPTASKTGQLWRSASLAIAIIIVGIIALILAQLLTMLTISIYYS